MLVAGLALIWGSNFLWIKVALGAFSPVQLTVARMVLGALVLLVVVAVRRERLPRGVGVWGHLVVAALVANAVPYLLFAVGETRVDSGVAGALNATTPLWTLLFGRVRLAGRRVAGLVLGFGGALAIFAPWSAGAIDTLGALYCLLAAVSYGVSYQYLSRFLAPRDLSPTVLSAGQLVAASGLTALALPLDTAGVPGWAPGPWAALAVLGVVGTGLAFVVNYALIRSEGAVGASVVTYLVPVASVGLGFVVLGETLPAWTVAGVAGVLAGVWLSRSRRLGE